MASTINQLSTDDTPSLSDLIALWSTANGDTRKTSLTALKALLVTSSSNEKITQYSSPSAPAFSVQITNGSNSVWLILSPTGLLSSGTIVLPAVANVVDKQEITLFSTQAVTTLTIDANGSTTLGAPTTLAQNSYFTLKFDAVMSIWYRIG